MEKTRNMKMTSIGLIPEDWEVITIAAVGQDFSYGVGAEAIPYNGEDKYIRITDINDVSHRYTPDPVTSPSFFNENHLLKENDIVVARTGASVGKSYLYNTNDGKLIFAGFLMKFNVPDVDARYVAYHFFTKRYWQWVNSESARTGQPGLNIQQLKQFSFPSPADLREQKRIADALSGIDDMIGALDEAIAKKRQIKEGLMQQLLTGKTAIPGFGGEWKCKRVGDIGFTYSGLTGKTKNDFGHGAAQYITFLNVLNNPVLNTDIFERVDVRGDERQNAAKKGDLFFNTSSETPEEVGICALLNADIDNLYLNSFCFGFRLTDPDVDGLYLSYFWRSKQGREIMSALAQGATRYNLSKEYFNKAVITLPPIELQRNIANTITAADNEIAGLKQKRDKYLLIKQGMMQEMLTGKTRLV